MAMMAFKKINQDFFKKWSSNMAYVLGYFIADGCISVCKNRIKNPYIFNITSVDLSHLYRIREAIGSNHKISNKHSPSRPACYQIQVRNYFLCSDLINLGIRPRKTYNLKPIKIPDEYFSDFVRGFFDGDGSVYIYNVNRTPQIKSGFVSASLSFIENFNKNLCRKLNISEKAIHKLQDKRPNTVMQYNTCFYIDDSEKLAKFMYGNNSKLFLNRKKKIFDEWKSIKRWHYKKENYPSKIGWHLNGKLLKTTG